MKDSIISEEKGSSQAKKSSRKSRSSIHKSSSRKMNITNEVSLGPNDDRRNAFVEDLDHVNEVPFSKECTQKNSVNELLNSAYKASIGQHNESIDVKIMDSTVQMGFDRSIDKQQ